MAWTDYLVIDAIMKYSSAEVKNSLKDAVRVNISDLVQNLVDGGDQDLNMPTTNLTPPFPNMWFEWSCDTNTAGVKLDLQKLNPNNSRWLPRDPNLYWVIRLRLFDANTIEFPLVAIVGLDKMGNKVSQKLSVEESVHKTLVAAGEWKVIEEFASGYKDLIILALGMMNCKNVALVEHTRPSVPRGKKSKKRPVPRLSYRTIRLPGVTYDSSGRSTMSKADMAHHLVRGHFKTYTAERPLLGKATGTYWWAPQARGKKSNGIIVKDYEVSQ